MRASALRIGNDFGSLGGLHLAGAAVRDQFPVLRRRVHGHPLVFLDSAASTQKPRAVIEAVTRFYTEEYANIHRGVYELSARATARYEGARARVARVIDAPSADEIVFVRGTTEAINLVAATFGEQRVGQGDEVLVTEIEHHANIVPWQMLCERKGARLRVVPVDGRGELDLEALQNLLTPRTRILAVTHVSNALGTVNPVDEIVAMAHARGVPVLVDGAQAIPHLPVDVEELGCDFYVFSGHKMYGPDGIGVLYGKREHLEAMPPYQTGGDMIRTVTFARTTFAEVPHKFEAGTPAIAAAVGLHEAMDFLSDMGMDQVAREEQRLLEHAQYRIAAIPGVRIIGTARHKVAVISFVIDGVHPHDIGTILDAQGVAIRAGHHCAQPTMARFGVPATARVSLGIYNTIEDIDALVAALHKVKEVLG